MSRLATEGEEPAMFICDTVFSSDGIFEVPDGWLREAYRVVRESGALCVADEVQAGFGRVGRRMWGFATDDAIPDIVTLGKPMGNGHPMGAVVTTREVAEHFAAGWHFFSTFAGSPVAAAVGSAVLDVLEAEDLAGRAERVGGRLRAGLRAIGHPAMTDVRGPGLFVGVELAEGDLAAEVVERMRRRRVLIGRTGPRANVLKIRPPLVFGDEHADRLVETLAGSLPG
jgi:4-aminobutyrate aminotransferase-like enzyme